MVRGLITFVLAHFCAPQNLPLTGISSLLQHFNSEVTKGQERQHDSMSSHKRPNDSEITSSPRKRRRLAHAQQAEYAQTYEDFW